MINVRGSQGNKKIFGPNKNCRQVFPQIFYVRSNHHECQPIQELHENTVRRFHISVMKETLNNFPVSMELQ